jgi:hypothetical protein
MLSVLLLDPRWDGLDGIVYGFLFVVGTTLIGLVIGIVVELQKGTAGSSNRAFIGLVILILLVLLLASLYSGLQKTI